MRTPIVSFRSLKLFGVLPTVAAFAAVLSACSSAPASGDEKLGSEQAADNLNCASTVTCPAGWNDSPPELTIDCHGAFVTYEVVNSDGSTVVLGDGEAPYVGVESDSPNSILVCAYGSPCVSFSNYAVGNDWCYVKSTGGGSGGKGGCRGGTCQ